MNTNYHEQDTPLLGNSEMSLGTDNQYFRTQSLTQKEVMSGSEVSTHPTKSVQKIKCFFSQIKIIEKFTFLKITKFTIFSKGKLLVSKLLFTALTHRVKFSTRPVNIQWVQIMGFGELVQNSRFHQALTLCLFGVRSQPRCLKLSTPRVLSIAQVKSRVARL